MKILSFAATNHKNSINKLLLQYTGTLIKEVLPNSEIELLDLIDYEMPFYRQDREQENGIPQQAQDFYKKIGDSDAIIISFAEHNSAFTAVYKNLFDWISRINQKVYQDKPIIIMAASPGGRGGMGVLGIIEAGAPHYGMKLLAKVSVPKFQENFDFEKSEIINEEIKQKIIDAIQTLKNAI